ncbi:MAG: hypothetical protein PVJ67_01085 [Candidatus Pacearchaeota archaeon]|jgi:hypothetical protein
MINERAAYSLGMNSKFGGAREIWKKHYDKLRKKEDGLSEKMGIWGPSYSSFVKDLPKIIEREENQERRSLLILLHGVKKIISKGIDSYVR